MKKTFAAAGVLLAVSLGASAAEPYRTYDNFSAGPIDANRWLNTERVLEIQRGSLRLKQRTFGSPASDSGATFSSWNDNLVNPTLITQIKAKITVDAIEVPACPVNTTPGQARARIIGGFFNVGVPTPGSQVGDVIAQVRLTRLSNSADPAGVLRVQGLASLCTNADCSAATTIGNIVELGKVSVGQATTVQMQWDQPAKTFTFARDNGAASGAVAYTESDFNPAGLAFRQLSTRLDLPNCLTSPRVSGVVDARFDNVQVNASAAP
ncbi:MAG: hypothetical protein U1F50_21115 [Rubrivivax sp.]